MTKQFKLAAKTRTLKEEKAAELRRTGYVPAVIYGSGTENLSLKIKQSELAKVYEQAGETNLIDLEIEGHKPSKVIIKAVARDAVKDALLHADFYQVDMKKAIEVEIPIKYIGESKAVKDQNAVLLKNLETINIKCLPGDLVESIEVDLSVLENFDDAIKISDLKLPGTLELLNPPSEMIANVTEPHIEEEVVEKPEAEAVAGEGEAKPEGETSGEAEDKEAKDEKKK